jgi:hypothetical protein
MRRFVEKKRRGMGLPTALVIVLVGAALITFAFTAASQFINLTAQQREAYVEHTRMTDVIEDVKGRISEYNYRKGEALHRPTIDYDHPYDPNVSNDQDLLIPQIPALPASSDGFPGSAAYSLRRDISIPERQQLLTLKVYDVTYTAANIITPISADVLAQIPAPLVVLSSADLDAGYLMESGRDVDVSSFWKINEETILNPVSWREFGAYLVRAELFDVSGGARQRIRLVDQAFFQVSSADM